MDNSRGNVMQICDNHPGKMYDGDHCPICGPALKVGDFVVYRNPMPDEMWNGEPLRFIIREIDNGRALIEAVTHALSISPTYRANVSELLNVNDLPE